MRVIIAGSRDITDIRLVMDLIDASYFDITTVISGCARGVDTLALMKPWACPIRRVPVTSADWDKWGKSAGYRRNTLMMLEADALIAVWDGKSPGTEHMIRIMRMAGKPVEVTRV